MRRSMQAIRKAAWYRKSRPTFADALAVVRKELWAQEQTFCGSPSATDTVKVPRAFVERLTDAVCYAASMAKVELEGEFSELRVHGVLRSSANIQNQGVRKGPSQVGNFLPLLPLTPRRRVFLSAFGRIAPLD